jgi:NTE family protein
MIIKRVCLSGGGVRIGGQSGALEELEYLNMLIHVKEWMGVSAGSLMALCKVIGFTTKGIHTLCTEFDFENVIELDSGPGCLINFGIDTGERLQRFINAVLHIKGFSSEITFKELYEKTNKSLRVFATDLNQGTYIEFSHKTNPEYQVSIAVRASMSFPYYFQPVEDPITGHLLSDGGIMNNYPIDILTEDERNETLGILFVEKIRPLEEPSLQNLLMRPCQLLLAGRGKSVHAGFSKHTICIRTKCTDNLKFNLSADEKKQIIEEGKEAVRDFLKQYRKPIRRFSI